MPKRKKKKTAKGRIEPISMKNKKAEMLEAYNTLFKEYKKMKARLENAPETDKVETKRAAATRKRAGEYTVDSIVAGLADLKLQLGRTLASVSDQLVAEVEKLETVKEAIALEQAYIEELHDIKIVGDTLAALIRTHDETRAAFEAEMAETERAFAEKMAAAQAAFQTSSEQERAAFETEMAERRAQWEKEEAAHKMAVKERDELLKKQREREAEEYTYTRKLQRKKEKDAYEAKKAELEKALREKKEAQERVLAEREAVVAAREDELATLRDQVDAFPAELAAAVEGAQKAAAVETRRELQHEADLVAREMAGERKVYELRIETLEATIEKQGAQIEALQSQLDAAIAHVQTIATKAIDGASGAKALTAVNEIALEQAKFRSKNK